MELANQLGSSIIVAYFLEWLKTSPLPILNHLDTSRYKAFIGFIAALITTVGISYTYDYNFASGGTITFAVPDVSTLFHGLADLIKQWAFQQGAYDGIVRNKNS
jgi:hypothetical protein